MADPLVPTPSRSRRRPTRREQLLLFLLLLVAAFAAFGWKPVRAQLLKALALRSNAPPETLLADLTAASPHPADFLTRVWKTAKLHHRQFVLGYLSQDSSASPELRRALEPFLVSATLGPDIESRHLAFSVLSRMKHPNLRPLAFAQLLDPDPEARVLGLQTLRPSATSNDVAAAVRLLEDPDPRVVVAAAQVLRQVTGENFGLNTSLALPQFTCVDTNPPPPPDLPAINKGVQRWREWWAVHHTDFPEAITPACATPPAAPLAIPEFRLEDPSDGIFKLSAFRGRKVLIAFWSVGAPASFDDATALNALQKLNPNRLVVLGICVPAPPSCADEHGDGSHGVSGEHAHHHAAHADTSPPLALMRVQARQAADRLKLNFPILLDPDGDTAALFKAENLPTYVLIDARGRIERRFVGFRDLAAFQRIIGSLQEEQHSAPHEHEHPLASERLPAKPAALAGAPKPLPP